MIFIILVVQETKIYKRIIRLLIVIKCLNIKIINTIFNKTNNFLHKVFKLMNLKNKMTI